MGYPFFLSVNAAKWQAAPVPVQVTELWAALSLAFQYRPTYTMRTLN